MKIKKKTGLMMIAASTAAVVGVAAVSFAAWTGSTSDTLTAQAQTGTIYTFGFNDATSMTLAGTKDTKNSTSLVPYNQPEATVKTGNYILTGKLPEYTVFAEDYSIAVTSAQSTGDYKLYVTITDTALTQADILSEDFNLNDWKEVSSTATLTKGETVTENGAIWYIANSVAVEDKTGVLNVILVSEVEGAPVSTTFDLTITVKTASDGTFYTTPEVQP